LLASLVITAWLASGAKRAEFSGKRMIKIFLALGLIGMVILGASGALTALGDTLFPSGSLAEGIQQDFLPTAHFLIRLRVLHPTIAIIVGIFLLTLAGIIRLQVEDPDTLRITRWLTLGIILQLGAGLLNLYLLAPVWMQIVHLFLADLVWIILVLLSYSSLGLGYNTRL
jgi:heme A synthase